jgi:diaminopimelate decarboxylase
VSLGIPPDIALKFGHSAETQAFWRRLLNTPPALSAPTPFFLLSAYPIAERISELDLALAHGGLPPATGSFEAVRLDRRHKILCRHWLSCKTQPVAPLLRWWREQGRDIEVVSEFELRAALAEGFSPPNILVNGPAKHHWLSQTGHGPGLRGLSVNFDSPAELAALLPLAKKMNWRCGVRLNTAEEYDPENPAFPTQFGFTPEEGVTALKKLQRARARVETVSFHLRTNISSAQIHQRAIAEVARICRAAQFAPSFLDVGGGLPVQHVLTRGGRVFDGEFGIRAFAEMLRQSVGLFPGLREVWLENGRFISAGSGVLVVRILDVKERRGLRQLICDGGRTLHALTSLWEQHKIISLPPRSGIEMLTAVHGPTCMAFDQLARIPLPRSLRAGDRLVWLDAGAYHIPWETRFSHGHAGVLWHDHKGLRPVREPQRFEDFWGQWNFTPSRRLTPRPPPKPRRNPRQPPSYEPFAAT